MTTIEDTIKWIATLERRLSVLETMEIGGYWFPFGPYTGATNNISATPTVAFAGTVPRNGTIIEFYTALDVLTTNNGSNYWTIEVHRNDTGATLFSVNTSAIAASTWTILSSVGRSDAITTGMIMLYINLVKTGAPGNLSITNPALLVL